MLTKFKIQGKPESIIHKKLKTLVANRLDNLFYDISIEKSIGTKKVDVFAYKKNEIVLCECVVSQTIKDAATKLLILKKELNNYQNIKLLIATSKIPIKKTVNLCKYHGINLVSFSVSRYRRYLKCHSQ